MDVITFLRDTPLPSLLVIGGFIFLFLGIATIKRPIVIDVTSSNRKIALILGILFVGAGLYLLALPAAEKTQTDENIVTAIPPTETLIPQGLESSTHITANTPTLEGLVSAAEVIVITEVLGNPCGADSRNEFIELYNSSENPIDVSGLWNTDSEEADEIITWQSRYVSVDLGSLATVNSTIIPSHGFAVVLAPGYPFVQTDRIMPYIFPPGTVILTIAEGQLLGDEDDGIEVSNQDIIALYKGNKSVIEEIVSTYGSPILSSSPLAIRDDGLDTIPIYGTSVDCWSVERIIPSNDDIETNWRQVEKSSPGESSYGNGDY